MDTTMEDWLDLLGKERTSHLFILCQACGCVCWSPSSSRESSCVAAGYSDGTLRIFRLASSEMEMKLQPHHVAVTAIQYSANGERGCPNKLCVVCFLGSVTSLTLLQVT